MTVRPRFLAIADKALALQVILIVCGTALAFSGSVWWMKPALGIATVSLMITWLARTYFLGRWIVLKSPITLLGLLALGLAVGQLLPLPGRLASLVSPRSRAVHTLGTLPELARADNPAWEMREIVADRTPATIDRAATLRWLLGAIAGLAVFCVCSHYADRLGHAAIIWGSVVCAFFIGTTFGVAQLMGGASGLYGAVEPGSGRPGMPTLDDQATSPGATVLRPVGNPNEPRAAWSLPRADRPFLFGTLMGGPGAYLALGALGLPLALGIALQLLAPRGSRDGLRARLRDSGRTGLLVLLLGMTATSSILVGYLAGPILAAPFAIGMILVGIPAAWCSGLRWLAVMLTGAMLVALMIGVAAGERLGRPRGVDALASGAAGWAEIRSIWRDSARAARDFPLVGSGLGSYPTIAAYYKTRDETWTTAGNSLLQWCVESGLSGMILAGLAGLWCIVRIPGAVRRVGSADRTLAFMMVGTLVCFGAFSAVHWSVELTAVAIAACAVGGTCNRWLAGGTDLFVECA
ncbi:MAG: lipid core-O-antigen ligase-like enyme [Planctomycetota bacterium]|nr:lipid core-O-antigen ligase-like enyme [Planctomycetota bacterium]